ncbi:MAG TPA: hypothetical protein VMF31_12340 [Solirubrobacterales bacterium]|nr:hypothetical protein [Solirubrobacterales bacterium]
MNEREAKDRCAELAESDPERFTHSWLPRKRAHGEWSIVKLAIPSPGTRELTATTAEGEQAIQEDPRTALRRNVGPNH